MRAMQVRVLYCGPCGYESRAEDLAHELRERFDAEVEIEEGKLGQFDVLLDGELVASKGGFWGRMLKHGAPPQPEIMASIERAMADRQGDACELTDAAPSAQTSSR